MQVQYIKLGHFFQVLDSFDLVFAEDEHPEMNQVLKASDFADAVVREIQEGQVGQTHQIVDLADVV